MAYNMCTTSTPLLAGHYYHIYNHGANAEKLFKEVRNYNYFLEQYTKYLAHNVETCAYCLLPTHFHLLIRINEINTNLDYSQTPHTKTLRHKETAA